MSNRGSYEQPEANVVRFGPDTVVTQDQWYSGWDMRDTDGNPVWGGRIEETSGDTIED